MRIVRTVDELILELKSVSDPAYLKGAQRFGIVSLNGLGVRMPHVRDIARTTVKNHVLALALWDTGIHEAKILASLLDVPSEVTEPQFDSWTRGFYSWDVCDQVIGNLFVKTEFALPKVYQYCGEPDEFVKRAGFVLMATAAVHLKKLPNEVFLPFFDLMIREANDDRNFVKKAVNWALRQLGKRNPVLKEKALQTAQTILHQDSVAARWIARDAIRELS